MRKTIGIVLLCGLALRAQAQETKQITRSSQNPFGQEKYSVLKADPKVKHGPYARLAGRGNALAESGYYRHGEKDSTWVEYHWGGQKVRARGQYRHDQRVGVWEVFDYQGELVQQYDYTRRQLLLNKPTKGAERITARPIAAGVTLSAAPVFVSGADALYQRVGEQVRYPTEALRRQVGGEVRIAFIVQPDGQTADYHVARGIGAGCDEEALRVVKLIPGLWVPAQADGQPVAAEVEVPITFTIR